MTTPTQQTPEAVKVTADAFIGEEEILVRNLESMVCAAINDLYAPRIVRPGLLSGIGQAAHQSAARQWCCFVLRHHPSFRWSFPKIARRYNRDHTSIMSGYNRIRGGIEQWRSAQHVDIFQSVCDAFSAVSGIHLRLWEVVGWTARPDVRKPKTEMPVRVEPKEKQSRAAALHARNMEIVRLYDEEKLSAAVIGDKCGLSPNRVLEIVDKCGNGTRSRQEALELRRSRQRAKQKPQPHIIRKQCGFGRVQRAVYNVLETRFWKTSGQVVVAVNFTRDELIAASSVQGALNGLKERGLIACRKSEQLANGWVRNAVMLEWRRL